MTRGGPGQWRRPPQPDLTVSLLAATTYFGYYALTDPWQRGWLYYSATGALVLALAVYWPVSSALGEVVRLWVQIESGQQAVCGSLTLATGAPAPDGRDVCVQYLGADIYRAVLALCLAALLVGVKAWQSRQRP